MCPSLLIKMSLFTPDLSLVSALYLSKISDTMSLQVRFPAVGILLLTWWQAGGRSEVLGGSH